MSGWPENARWIPSRPGQKTPLNKPDKDQDFIRLECQLGGVSTYLLGDMMTSLMPQGMTRGCYWYQIPLGGPVYVWLGYDAYGIRICCYRPLPN